MDILKKQHFIEHPLGVSIQRGIIMLQIAAMLLELLQLHSPIKFTLLW